MCSVFSIGARAETSAICLFGVPETKNSMRGREALRSVSDVQAAMRVSRPRLGYYSLVRTGSVGSGVNLAGCRLAGRRQQGEYVDVFSLHRQSLQDKKCFHNQYLHTCAPRATTSLRSVGVFFDVLALTGCLARSKEMCVERRKVRCPLRELGMQLGNTVWGVRPTRMAVPTAQLACDSKV
jgi:hypothetical protein